MKYHAQDHLDAYLDTLLERLTRMRELNPHVEADREQALEESQKLMGGVLRYRHMLEQADECEEELCRVAA